MILLEELSKHFVDSTSIEVRNERIINGFVQVIGVIELCKCHQGFNFGHTIDLAPVRLIPNKQYFSPQGV